MQGVTEGRIVHFVLDSGRCEGEHRPAVIVRVPPEETHDGVVNLQVFLDKPDLLPAAVIGADILLLWRGCVPYSETKEPGTWHWPERA